jgi:hypothetical protein
MSYRVQRYRAVVIRFCDRRLLTSTSNIYILNLYVIEGVHSSLLLFKFQQKDCKYFVDIPASALVVFCVHFMRNVVETILLLYCLSIPCYGVLFW